MSNAEAVTGRVASRYASALLELAEEAGSLTSVEKDLKTLKTLFENSTDLRAFATNPLLSSANQADAFLQIASKAGFGKLTQNFIGTVSENGRASQFPQMVTAFEEQLAKKRGTQTALVTSAHKLGTAQIRAIARQLEKSIGRNVTINTRMDPDVLGGFSVKIGSRFFDSTLKTRLEGLKIAMKEA